MKIEKLLNETAETPGSAFFYTPAIYNKSYSYWFTGKPAEIISASTIDEIKSSIKKINKKLKQELVGYALITYEAGYSFERKLHKYFPQNEKSIFSFYFFEKEQLKIFKSSNLSFSVSGIEDYSISNFKFNTSADEFSDAVSKIKGFIAEGDTYQVNYTIKGKFNYSGNPADIFKRLLFNQSAKYSAFINCGNNIIISASPELFFHFKKGKIITKPMKGTGKRGINISQDILCKNNLGSSKKDRAENLMIVDLIRNDLGRISKFGSVKVKELFSLEKYESVYQMISVIQSKISGNLKFGGIIENLFPCGSITGAPKIRTMEIIKELEKEERGIYTGAIGFINNNEAIFNVPIRTIVLNKENRSGEIGIGSGVTWYSDPQKEYDETVLKSNFFTNPKPYFELLETMKYEAGKVFLLDEHLERLKSSADFWLFMFDEKKIRKFINKFIKEFNPDEKYKLRLTLNKWGKISIEKRELENLPDTIKIIISNKKVNSKDQFKYFKTTNRKLYNEEFQYYNKKGFTEVIFFNEKKQISEGAITNIFIVKNNKIYTPSVNSGILPGVFRKYLLQNNAAIKETFLFKNDLLDSDEIFITNSVREIIKVDQLYLNEKEYKEFKSPILRDKEF